MNKTLIILFLLSISACMTTTKTAKLMKVKFDNSSLKKAALSQDELINWHFKDVSADTIPGISLRKAEELMASKKPEVVIVAVIDMPIDIEHPMLSELVWTNSKEIPNNNIDDDNNGYKDDYHGWNFLGTSDGNGSDFVNYEYTRILKKIEDSSGKVSKENSFIDSAICQRAKQSYAERKKFANGEFENALALLNIDKLNKELLSPYFPSNNFTLQKLDSLSIVLKDSLSLLEQIGYRKELITYGLSDQKIQEEYEMADKRVDVLLNLDYDDRTPIGDLNPENIQSIQYGNNNVSYNATFLDHGTKIAGVIVRSNSNKENRNGITSNVKIMPLCISAFGDEHDKDIALAIRYAVDNGARVINISSGKNFSMHQNWVLDAIRYADKKEVLIVTSSGNSGENLDKESSNNYPNDRLKNGVEVANNFIKVGSSAYELNSNIYGESSNYGHSEVDLFAPGEQIYTISAGYNDLIFDSGTSMSSAVVSGVAAMVFSYYPDLSASQMKDILLNSGLEYNLRVDVLGPNESKIQLPFNKLSKTGKIINAFNALLVADKYSKQKK